MRKHFCIFFIACRIPITDVIAQKKPLIFISNVGWPPYLFSSIPFHIPSYLRNLDHHRTLIIKLTEMHLLQCDTSKAKIGLSRLVFRSISAMSPHQKRAHTSKLIETYIKEVEHVQNAVHFLLNAACLFKIIVPISITQQWSTPTNSTIENECCRFSLIVLFLLFYLS